MEQTLKVEDLTTNSTDANTAQSQPQSHPTPPAGSKVAVHVAAKSIPAENVSVKPPSALELEARSFELRIQAEYKRMVNEKRRVKKTLSKSASHRLRTASPAIAEALTKIEVQPDVAPLYGPAYSPSSSRVYHKGDTAFAEKMDTMRQSRNHKERFDRCVLLASTNARNILESSLNKSSAMEQASCRSAIVSNLTGLEAIDESFDARFVNSLRLDSVGDRMNTLRSPLRKMELEHETQSLSLSTFLPNASSKKVVKTEDVTQRLYVQRKSFAEPVTPKKKIDVTASPSATAVSVSERLYHTPRRSRVEEEPEKPKVSKERSMEAMEHSRSLSARKQRPTTDGDETNDAPAEVKPSPVKTAHKNDEQVTPSAVQS